MDRTAPEQTQLLLGVYRRQLDANRRLLDRVDAVCAEAHETLARALQTEARLQELLAEMDSHLRRHAKDGAGTQ